MSILRRFRAVDASEVMPGLLVGSAPNAGQRARLTRRGVTFVVDLRAEVANEGHWPTGIVVRRMPVVDRRAPDPDELADLATWVVGAMRHGEVVLIHGHAGIGRAPTAACAVLIELGYTVAESYNAVRDARPMIAPTDAQIAALHLLERSAAGHQLSGASVQGPLGLPA